MYPLKKLKSKKKSEKISKEIVIIIDCKIMKWKPTKEEENEKKI